MKLLLVLVLLILILLKTKDWITKNKKKIFSIFTFLILLATPILIIFIFGKTLKENSKYLESSWGAFFGAFFAFSFLIIEKFVSRYYKRYAKHKNALIRLDRLINWNFCAISDNIYLIDGMIKSINERVLYYFNFKDLRVDQEITIESYNIDLINDLFVLYIDMEKINNDLNMLTESYKEGKIYLMDKKITKLDFDNHANEMISYLNLIKGGLKDMDSEMEKIAAKNRILMRKKSIASFLNDIIMNLFNLNYNHTEKKENKELEIIKGERKKSAEQSKEKIEKIKKETNFK